MELEDTIQRQLNDYTRTVRDLTCEFIKYTCNHFPMLDKLPCALELLSFMVGCVSFVDTSILNGVPNPEQKVTPVLQLNNSLVKPDTLCFSFMYEAFNLFLKSIHSEDICGGSNACLLGSSFVSNHSDELWEAEELADSFERFLKANEV